MREPLNKRRKVIVHIPLDVWSLIATYLNVHELIHLLCTSHEIQDCIVNNLTRTHELFWRIFSLEQWQVGMGLYALDEKNKQKMLPSIFYLIKLLYLKPNALPNRCSLNDLFIFACRMGSVDLVDTLMHKLNVNPSCLDNLAIQLASNGHLPVVQALISDKRVNPATDDNFACRKANQNGHKDIVTLLKKDKRVQAEADRLLKEVAYTAKSPQKKSKNKTKK